MQTLFNHYVRLTCSEKQSTGLVHNSYGVGSFRAFSPSYCTELLVGEALIVGLWLVEVEVCYSLYVIFVPTSVSKTSRMCHPNSFVGPGRKARLKN